MENPGNGLLMGRFRFASFGLGFFSACFYSSFFAFTLISPEYASNSFSASYWLSFDVGAIVGICFLLALEKSLGQISMRGNAQLIATIGMVLGIVLVVMGAHFFPSSALIIVGIGSFITGLSNAPLVIAWGAQLSSLNAEEAEGIIPANILLSMILTVLVCVIGGWVSVILTLLFPVIAFFMLRREQYYKNGEELRMQDERGVGKAIQDSEHTPTRASGPLIAGNTISNNWRTMLLLMVSWIAFSLLRTLESPTDPQGFTFALEGVFLVGTIVAALITYTFLFYAKRITFFSMLRVAFPITCASLVILVLLPSTHSNLAFAVSFPAAICLDIFVWFELVSLIKTQGVSPTKSVGLLRLPMQTGAFIGILIVVALPFIPLEDIAGSLIVLLALAIMCAVSDTPMNKSPRMHPTHEVQPLLPLDAQENLFEAHCKQLSQEYGLSPREEEVLALLGRGRDVPYIRDELYISRNTVNSHVKSIYRKLEIHSKQELLDLLDLP